MPLCCRCWAWVQHKAGSVSSYRDTANFCLQHFLPVYLSTIHYDDGTHKPQKVAGRLQQACAQGLFIEMHLVREALSVTLHFLDIQANHLWYKSNALHKSCCSYSNVKQTGIKSTYDIQQRLKYCIYCKPVNAADARFVWWTGIRRQSCSMSSPNLTSSFCVDVNLTHHVLQRRTKRLHAAASHNTQNGSKIALKSHCMQEIPRSKS